MTHTLKPNQEQTSATPALRLPWLITLGIFFWFVAAMIIRFVGPYLFIPGSVILAVTFALSIPFAWLFYKSAILAAGAKGATLMPSVLIMNCTAMLFDGIALTFFPTLYGPTFAIGGAWILWGLAWIQIFALLKTYRFG